MKTDKISETKKNKNISDIDDIEKFISNTKKQNKALKKMLDNFEKKKTNNKTKQK